MRREVSFRRNWKLAVHPPPAGPLSRAGVTLRKPEAPDAVRLAGYAAQSSQLDGLWIGAPPPDLEAGLWAHRCIEQWTLGWTPEGSDAGPAFIVDGRDPFVGIVQLSPSSERRMELLYGVLPTARGRDVATRAVRLATTWALGNGGFTRVELKVEEGHLASRRVAEKAGFQLVERVETYVAGTGQTHIDCLYLRTNK